MRLRIHRGTKEIGGTCIEVEVAGKRLALDVGLPLDAPDGERDTSFKFRYANLRGPDEHPIIHYRIVLLIFVPLNPPTVHQSPRAEDPAHIVLVDEGEH